MSYFLLIQNTTIEIKYETMTEKKISKFYTFLNLLFALVYYNITIIKTKNTLGIWTYAIDD